MELKDVILSTLAEMEDTPTKPVTSEFEVKEKIIHEVKEEKLEENIEENLSIASSDGELMYLKSIKERLLVLFEGFQAPNNTNIEAKIDMTLNFLEYTLATIDTRVEMLEKGKNSEQI
ncbi:MAG: hypothetical protein K8R44_09380 [Sulfurimonas sp.]|nr:hypothetical protein [Sulfurimonas sp.]